VQVLRIALFIGLFAMAAVCKAQQGSGSKAGAESSGPPFVVGSVVSIGEKTITVKSDAGADESVNIGSNTRFSKETPMKKSELKIGDVVMMICDAGDGQKLCPRKFVVQMGDVPPPSIRKGMPSGGPVFASIEKTDPLIVTLESGESKEVELAGEGSITRQTTISLSDISTGATVRVLRDSQAKTAIRIIYLPEGAQTGVPQVAEKTELMPDIPQQPADCNFIYGVWLGRGLFTNAELDRAFKVAANLGVRYLKIEFKWGYVEPAKGKWQWTDESHLDVEHVILLAKQYQMSVIPYFDMFMPWGKKKMLDPKKDTFEGPLSRQGQSQAPDSAEYAEYVFAVVNKLVSGGVNVRYIELDNEESVNNDGQRTYGSFIDISARQLKQAENAAYDRVKSAYPKIMVSSTTFAFPGLPAQFGPEVLEKRKIRLNQFVEAYFGQAPKPKFDFLGIHETLGGSGNPWTKWEQTEKTKYRYNFGSYNDAFDIWRKVLNEYGYTNTPIFNTESSAVLRNKQDAELIQKNVFSRANAAKNKVIGCIVSQLTGSKAFSEGGNDPNLSVGITRLGDAYHLRSGYFGYYALMSIMAKYPRYEGKLIGDLNSSSPWIQTFGDPKGNALYVAFLPYHLGESAPVQVALKIGTKKTAVIVHPGEAASLVSSDETGRITFAVTEQPVFIQVPSGQE
jgi:hypothetical protein